MTNHERLRAAIQALLDQEGDGYALAHYVVVMGIEKMDTSTGRVTTAAWLAKPEDQADYITDGLLSSADDIRAFADIEDSDD